MSKNHLNFDHETKGWVDLIQPREPRPKLTSHIDTNWLVIGAGFTGLSCARRLAELNPSEKIVLLEARDFKHHFRFFDQIHSFLTFQADQNIFDLVVARAHFCNYKVEKDNICHDDNSKPNDPKHVILSRS